MISFECDYNNGAHPKVLENLIKYNNEKPTPYGFDAFSERAKERIRQAIGMPDAQIFFLTGGTQTNATTIDSMLYQYEGVICVGTGHINVHEAGAVEFTEHKIITLPDELGKMNYKVCQHYNIPLYIDGARLGYGLMAEGCDITLPYLARHCDVFYIGGTKIGALCGEAVVFTNRLAHKHFFSIQKQHGAVIAKGALIGLQFDALFTDELYFKLSRHAIDMAMRMKAIFKQKGCEFFIDSPTNQQFVILPNETVDRLSKNIEFTHWGKADIHHTVCRFVTSWATTDEELDELERML